MKTEVLENLTHIIKVSWTGKTRINNLTRLPKLMAEQSEALKDKH